MRTILTLAVVFAANIPAFANEDEALRDFLSKAENVVVAEPVVNGNLAEIGDHHEVMTHYQFAFKVLKVIKGKAQDKLQVSIGILDTDKDRSTILSEIKKGGKYILFQRGYEFELPDKTRGWQLHDAMYGSDVQRYSPEMERSLSRISKVDAESDHKPNATVPAFPRQNPGDEKAPPPTQAAQQADSPVKLTERQAQLLKEMSKMKGVDAVNWGEPIANPFTNLTSEGKQKLKEHGIDAERLQKMRSRLLTGSFTGANSKNFMNADANTILVFGRGFFTHGQVYSVGPVLAAGNAHFMGDVTGAGLVWFVDKSVPRGEMKGVPLLLAPAVSTDQMRDRGEMLQDDFGWRPPDNFCKPAADAK